MADRFTSALQAGQVGASIGTALAPGVGTAIGAGVGALGGAFFGGPSAAEAMSKERMEELRRRQELGTLGFTDEEIRARLAPMQEQAAQQAALAREQQAALLASQGVGAGAAVKAQQAEAQRQQQVQAQLAHQVQQESLQRQAQQENELLQLMGLEAQREQANTQARIAAGIGLAETTAVAMGQVDELERADEVKETLMGVQYSEEERSKVRAYDALKLVG